MYKAKDGKAFGNHEMGKRYDESRKSADDGEGHEEPGGDEHDIEDSVAEHGPVSHIEMHSHHEDGHVHKSTHHDHQSAHKHVSKAFDEGEESEGAHEADEGEDENESSPIPTLG